MKHGKFIVFEGLDGSGLSTHSGLLRDWLVEKGYRVHLSAEPTDSPIGSLIRLILKRYWQIPRRPDILALLYAADRLYHVNFEQYSVSGSHGLQNALYEGYMVIYNRYILSSFAYQNIPFGGVEVSLDWLKLINKFAVGNGTPIPDLVIFIDVPPEECIKRIVLGREKYELFEDYSNLSRVYDNFKKLIKGEEFNVVEIQGIENGLPRSKKDVQNDIREAVSKELKIESNA